MVEPGTMSPEEVVELTRKHSIFSWSAGEAVSPIPMKKAKGVYFWDAHGKRYLDLNSQLMCVNIGHGDPRMAEAIARQARELAYAGPGMATEVRARVGRRLAALTPGDLNHFFFTLGGAEANENAIRAARAYTGRHKILTRYRSYHGATAGAMTLTGEPRRWPNEPGIPGVIRAFDPYRYRSHLDREGESDEEFAQRCLAQLEEIIVSEGAHTIAAFFLETVTGTNGIIIPPPGYLRGVRELCDRYGILMVCDEVMCGLGRTGEWFAVNHWDVVPDMITMAKGLTSAYLPLGAVAMSEKIARHFQTNVFYGGLTYNAHPMCLAAAEACLAILAEDDLVGNAKRMGHVMKGWHQELRDRHPCIGETRSIGLFGVLELVKDRETREPLAPFPSGPAPIMAEIGAFLRENGVYAFINRHLIHTNPPLCITESELREAFEIVDRALDIADRALADQ